MNNRVDIINMIKEQPQNRTYTQKGKIKLEFPDVNSSGDLLIHSYNNKIRPFGKIVSFGSPDDYLGLRENILKYELKFARIGGCFAMGCDGKVVEILSSGFSEQSVIIPVEFFMDMEVAVEAFYEAGMYTYGHDIKDFYLFINQDFHSNIQAAQEVINGYFTKDKR